MPCTTGTAWAQNCAEHLAGGALGRWGAGYAPHRPGRVSHLFGMPHWLGGVSIHTAPRPADTASHRESMANAVSNHTDRRYFSYRLLYQFIQHATACKGVANSGYPPLPTASGTAPRARPSNHCTSASTYRKLSGWFVAVFWTVAKCGPWG